MVSSPDPQELRKLHMRARRVYDRAWLSVIAITTLTGPAIWLFTGDATNLYCIFYGVFPFLGLLHNHFILFNSRRDPVLTQHRLEEFTQKRLKTARSVAYTNGWMLIVVTPLFGIVGVAIGAENGLLGAILGGLFVLLALIGGLAAVQWSRHL